MHKLIASDVGPLPMAQYDKKIYMQDLTILPASHVQLSIYTWYGKWLLLILITKSAQNV